MFIFRFLLIVFIFFYVLMLIGRLLLKKFVNKSRSQFNNRAYGDMRKNKRKGEVSVDYQPKEKKHIPDDEGDYVDYEEVK